MLLCRSLFLFLTLFFSLFFPVPFAVPFPLALALPLVPWCAPLHFPSPSDACGGPPRFQRDGEAQAPRSLFRVSSHKVR